MKKDLYFVFASRSDEFDFYKNYLKDHMGEPLDKAIRLVGYEDYNAALAKTPVDGDVTLVNLIEEDGVSKIEGYALGYSKVTGMPIGDEKEEENDFDWKKFWIAVGFGLLGYAFGKRNRRYKELKHHITVAIPDSRDWTNEQKDAVNTYILAMNDVFKDHKLAIVRERRRK